MESWQSTHVTNRQARTGCATVKQQQHGGGDARLPAGRAQLGRCVGNIDRSASQGLLQRRFIARDHDIDRFVQGIAQCVSKASGRNSDLVSGHDRWQPPTQHRGSGPHGAKHHAAQRDGSHRQQQTRDKPKRLAIRGQARCGGDGHVATSPRRIVGHNWLQLASRAYHEPGAASMPVLGHTKRVGQLGFLGVAA
jgi:hypothetical protein